MYTITKTRYEVSCYNGSELREKANYSSKREALGAAKVYAQCFERVEVEKAMYSDEGNTWYDLEQTELVTAYENGKKTC